MAHCKHGHGGDGSCPDCAAERIAILAELKEQNRRLVEAWKQSRTETTISSTPGQYISGPRVVTGYEYADLPHGLEEGYEDDAENGGAQMPDNSGCADDVPWMQPTRITMCLRCVEKDTRIAELDATLFSARQALLSEGVRSGVIERERDEARERVSDLKDKLDAIDKGGHASYCSGVDEAVQRCGCGYLQRTGAHEHIRRLERERDEARVEVTRLRQWLSQRTPIVGTTLACEAVVSDTCIANRGPDGAASEACLRLRRAFGLLLSGAKYQEGRKYRFVLVVEDAPKGGSPPASEGE